MPGIVLPALTQLLTRLGPAEIFIGDPMTASGLISLGTLEGERRFDPDWATEALTLPEQTGAIPHDVRVAVNGAKVTGTLVLNNQGAAIWPKISPLGTTGGGGAQFKSVTPTGLLLIPHSELGGGLSNVAAAWTRLAGNGIAAGSGVAAAPAHSVWLWRCYPSYASVPYKFGDAGKTAVDVTFQAMLDVTKPDGYMVFDIGDPRAATHGGGISVTL
jgi:hypothetical protein